MRLAKEPDEFVKLLQVLPQYIFLVMFLYDAYYRNCVMSNCNFQSPARNRYLFHCQKTALEGLNLPGRPLVRHNNLC